MIENKAYEIVIGETENGFVAASLSSPYFCFEAATEEEAIETAKRALGFAVSKARPVAASPSRLTLDRPALSRRVELPAMAAIA